MMTTKLLLAASVTTALFAGGCRQSTPEKACQHFKALATAKVDRDLKRMNSYGVGGSLSGAAYELKQKAKDFDVETCAAGLEAKGIDPSCLADASTFDEAVACGRDAKKTN